MGIGVAWVSDTSYVHPKTLPHQPLHKFFNGTTKVAMWALRHYGIPMFGREQLLLELICII